MHSFWGISLYVQYKVMSTYLEKNLGILILFCEELATELCFFGTVVNTLQLFV